MKYQTTNLQPTKRYPTYQFHARTAQKKLPAEQVFCICVLETLHWLRSRLKNPYICQTVLFHFSHQWQSYSESRSFF